MKPVEAHSWSSHDIKWLCIGYLVRHVASTCSFKDVTSYLFCSSDISFTKHNVNHKNRELTISPFRLFWLKLIYISFTPKYKLTKAWKVHLNVTGAAVQTVHYTLAKYKQIISQQKLMTTHSPRILHSSHLWESKLQ